MDIIIKGIIIGIGKIIPGVSGSMLAITMGVYEKIIESLSDLKKELLTKSTFLIKIGIGIVLSIIFMSKIIVKCLNNYYLPTMLLFVGLIIGGTLKIINDIKLTKNNIILTTILTLIIYILTKQIKIDMASVELKYSIEEFINIFKIGFIDAISSIVPGISGTAILMILGYYNIILETFGNILSINLFKNNLFVLIPFGMGFIIGLIITSKIIKIVIKKFKNTTYIIVIILMISTIIVLSTTILKKINSIFEIIIYFPLLIIGIIISNKLE